MIWGGITMRSRTDLVVINGNLTGQRYIDKVLQPVVVPFLRQNNAILQDDNARTHRAARVQQYIQQRNIQHIDWPARSPDLSPIEHLWDILGQGVRNRNRQPKALQLLEAALREEWNRIPQYMIARLIMSMRRRCEACIRANGGHTSY
jgi:hypothetical protein